MAVSAGPAVPPRSVFPFRVRCGFRRSLVLGLVVVDGLRSVSQTAVPRGTEQPGARLSPGWSASKRRGLCAVTPVLARESSPACGFSTGSVDGQTARPSGGAIGAERRRVENSRRRPSAAASTRASYGSGAARLAAALSGDALGRLAACSAPWGRAFHVGGPVCSAPASLRPSSRSDGVVRTAGGVGRGMTGVYGARVIELAVDQEKAPVESVPRRLSGRLYRISGCGRAGVALLGVEGATPVRDGWLD